jgi:hypothetical protein
MAEAIATKQFLDEILANHGSAPNDRGSMWQEFDLAHLFSRSGEQYQRGAGQFTFRIINV